MMSNRQGLREVGLDPITLTYNNAALEKSFRQKQKAMRLNNDTLYQNLNIAIGALHCSMSVFLMEGTLLSPRMPFLVLPYVFTAIMHKMVASTQLYAKRRLVLVIALEAAYAGICVLSMPYWVLQGHEVLGGRMYAKDFLLGSGVLISYWLLFLLDKPFIHSLWVLPLECLGQVVFLSGATCSVLDATENGRQISKAIAGAMTTLASFVLPTNSSSSSPCMDLVISWQTCMCIALIYFKYRLELRERVIFTKGDFDVASGWPASPLVIQVAIHAVVCLQLILAVWVFISSS